MKLSKAGVLAFQLLSFTAFGKEAKKRVAVQPNIIHIMTDDHSFQTLSAYGHPLSRLAPTPNIDRLAREGMIFNRAFVENSLSTPSRACLMTGLYSHQNGQRQLGAGIDTTHLFFSELLHEAGYQTGVVGKWHMQCRAKGFDFYHILWDQGSYYNPEFLSPASNGKYVREEGYATTLTTDHALRFLEQRDTLRPFCLLVHHKAPHRNWMPDTTDLKSFCDVEFPYPQTFYDDYTTRSSAATTQKMHIGRDMTLCYDLKVGQMKGHENAPKWLDDSYDNEMRRMTAAQKKAWDAAYADENDAFMRADLKGDELLRWKYQRYIKDYVRCIKSVDREVGRLLDYLDANGLADNTIVVYTSDQGFYMGEHGWFDKRFMYEESFRTPLLIRYPAMIAPMSQCDALVQNIDYAPTYLSLAGMEIPEKMVGKSLEPLFEGLSAAKWRKYLYYHYYDYPAAHYVRRHDGVRDRRYKLIHFYGQGAKANDDEAIDANELYDLKKDPCETVNLYDNPRYRKVVERMQNELSRFRKEEAVDEW